MGKDNLEDLEPLLSVNDVELSDIENATKDIKHIQEPVLTERPDQLTVLCIPLHKFSHTVQFTLCTIGVLVFFISYGYFQELMFQLPGFRPFGMYLTLIQFMVNAFLAFFERLFRGETSYRIPLKTHCLIAFLSVSTMGLSNTSVGYLNYPTHVIFKCCTLIPVLIGGVLIQGKEHDRFDVLAAIFMSVGLVCFMLTDSTVSPNFNIIGVTLVLLALVADAAIGNLQEKAMKQYSSSVIEVVFFSNNIGIVYLVILLLMLGQFWPAFTYCNKHKMETYGYGVLFSILGYCGLQMILALVRISGAFVTAIVANCRKGLTVIISFIAFAKPFSYQYVWSGMLVTLGIFFNLLGKNPQLKKWTFLKLKYLADAFTNCFYLFSPRHLVKVPPQRQSDQI